MKKLLILLILLIIPSVCNAEILDDFKEMRYRLEAGLTYQEYRSAYQTLYISYRKSETTKYKDLIDLYNSVLLVWDEGAQGNNNYAELSKFFSKYDKKECRVPNTPRMSNVLCATIKTATELEKQ